jgi:hypothetical protein
MRTIEAIASAFGTGSEPGSPRHTGQTFALGGDPNSLRHPQNIFVRVDSSTWHSNPMTDSKISAMRPKSSRVPEGPRPVSRGGSHRRCILERRPSAL